MNRTSIRRAIVPGVAALAIALSGCGAANDDGDGGSTGGDGEISLSGTLNGAGASSQEAAQAAWRAGFQSANEAVTVNYDPAGSGGGRSQFIAGGVSFAGSDAYFDEDELAAATERCAATEPIQVPAYISPIAVVYNVDGVDNLQLAPETITGIFAGEITTWNDPRIAADTEGVDLPDANIVAVHHGDESGTTDNFTTYLAAAGGWAHDPSDTWPITGGEAATGTSGVIDAVGSGSNTIGYADASQAGSLSTVAVQVGEAFVGPDAEAAGKIIGASPRVDEASEVNFAVDIDHTTTAEGTYPIVLASYLLACQTYEDAGEADLVKGYLSYVLSTDGQNAAAENAGSAPLASEVQEAALAAVEKIAAE